MANNRVGCSNGKTLLVDPNKFDGQSSFTNMSVPLEDLNISVELTTSKKARTVLVSTNNGESIINTGSNSETVTINFIDGTNINGKKVLTTSFTDLTTSFDQGNNGENLGITNIDIDFSSAYAPQITINFIDVRGSAIFQNENNAGNNLNKYSVFFQLPYPIYQLTIKGYYGKPVTYCIHMTKFNSKFNSQTGNFEITASYIGYTYAMLTDMLVGFLKAIPYTALGKIRFEELRKQQPDGRLLTLEELMSKISDVNSSVNKIKSTDVDSNAITDGLSKLELLSKLETNLNLLGMNLDEKEDLNTYRYIIMKSVQTTSLVEPTNNNENSYSQPYSTNNNLNNKIDSSKKSYDTAVTSIIKTYNDNNSFKLNESDFIKIRLYQDITIKLLSPELLPISSNNNILITKIGDDDFDNRKNNILDAIKSRGLFGDDQSLNIYDLSKQYDLIDEKRNQINTQIEKLKKSLGQTLKNEVSNILGFDPTIRNIIKIFCAHIEVFLGVIHDVAAATKNNPARTAQLKKFITEPDAYDIKQNAISPSGSAVGELDDQIYPWPEYRKGNADVGFTETYLGEIGVLNKPKDVTELAFIDDLLKAFLVTAKLETEIGNKIGAEETNWYPINPLDSKLFINKTPYKRIDGQSRKEVIAYMVIRAMIYLGYSNKKLMPEEIQTMANLEAESVLNNVIEDKILQTLIANLDISDFKNVTENSVFGDGDTLVIKPDGINYYYDYIFPSDLQNPNVLRVLPLENNFKDSYSSTPSELVTRSESEKFLTNYGNALMPKVNDGGTYVKILSINDYNSKSKPLVAGPSVTDGILNLNKLKQTPLPLDVGFNPFGGVYGIQEFSNLDYGDESLNGLSLSYVFYSDGNNGSKTFNKSNGLGYVRSISGPSDSKNTTTSYYDIIASQYNIPTQSTLDNLNGYIDGSDTDRVLHKNYGKNRLLIKEYFTNPQKITYPFVNFYVRDTPLISNTNSLGLVPVSLFGSRLYYEQSNSQYEKYAKALLFLHTLPFNGLIDQDLAFLITANFNINRTIFDVPEILNLFSNRAGFIKAPKLWAAFIGGMLWRADSSQPSFDLNNNIISGGSGLVDPIVFYNTTDNFIPTFNITTVSMPSRLQYLTSKNSLTVGCPMCFDLRGAGLFVGWKNLDEILLNLPDQVKDEFKRIFFEFVSKNTLDSDVSDWDIISGQLEIFNGTGTDWVNAYTQTMSNVTTDYKLNTTITKGIYNASYHGNAVWDNYIMVAPMSIADSAYENNFILELKGGASDNQAIKSLIDKFTEEIVIMNTYYKIWEPNDGSISQSFTHTNIQVQSTNLDLYFKTIIDKFKTKATNPNEKTKQDEQNLFGTSDENLIKFNLYRTLKGIYDKWVGGAENVKNGSDIIFQCGSRNVIDSALAIKARGDGANPSLIDSFRFVTRSFKDIGDDFIINPLPINDFLLKNINSSVYDSITSLLSANNFDFIALPSYINYNDDNELASMFKPLPYNEAISEGTSGPAFVCVYVGQSSKNLDFGNSNYPNDGFDIQCDNNGSMLPGIPTDFSNNAKDYENNVAVFAVNYGQQNQNIFKDISLDQSEFSETAESLQIVEDISKKGSETNRTFVGQNIFNVYQTRSYKTEVEMMGNAMIQPMMYFQLNNIPMFHGAYMITRVRHNVKPNYMSTHFTGVRIRKAETPLIDVSSLYMNMLDAMTGSDIGVGSGADNNKRVFGGNVIGNQKQYVGYVSYEVNENKGLIYQEKNPNAGGDNYAMKEVGQFIEKLAIQWQKQAQPKPYGDILYINNFGAYGGGTNKKHGEKSKHDIGLAVDFRPIGVNKSIQLITVSSANYDHDANIKLIELVFDLIAKENGTLELDNIILNDAALIANFNGRKNRNGGNIVISSAGHDNHIHIEFYVPKRIEDRVIAGYLSEEDIITSSVIGSVAKYNGIIPSITEKEKSLGQI